MLIEPYRIGNEITKPFMYDVNHSVVVLNRYILQQTTKTLWTDCATPMIMMSTKQAGIKVVGWVGVSCVFLYRVNLNMFGLIKLNEWRK